MAKNRLTQQRVIIPPTKNMAFFDDDDDDDDSSSVGYSLTSSINTRTTATDTCALAEFLSSTSPEEFAKPSAKKRQQRASRLLGKLRKRATNGSLNDSASVVSTALSAGAAATAKKHIPLPEYNPPLPPPVRSPASMRDSGVYSEVSDKDYTPARPPMPPPPVPCLDQFPMPPSIPAKSRARPRRPAPLPADVASAAINAALRTVPEAALRRRSVARPGKQATPPTACPHCRQHIQSNKEDRRLSCPPALATGVVKEQSENTLRAMIAQLEQQLADERMSRKKLEQVVSRQHQAVVKREQVAEERDRWKGDCSWMEDRIALLPE